jgi:eukaryotic-like serine/threonine-protein kinase
MGAVYEARDPLLGRRVALKCVHPGCDSPRVPRARQRALAEARALARLNSSHVVQVFDVGEYDGQIYFTMDLIDGMTLEAWLAAEPRNARAIFAKFMAAGRGLADAHSAGLVHRDFKPSNVLVANDGRVLVADFGLAIGGDHGDEPTAIAGTRRFMAPEVRAGRPPDARADQYSWCRALTDALAERAGVRVGRGRVPRAVTMSLARGLHEDPDARWGSMSELLTSIERASAPRRRRRLAAVALGGAGWLLAGSAQTQPVPCPLPASSAPWTPARRAEIRDALQQRSPEYAHYTWPRIEAHVDAFLADWETARQSVCELASLEQSSTDRVAREVACLEDRHVQLATVLDVLASPDEATIEYAARAIAALPEVEDCSAEPKTMLTGADASARHEIRLHLERVQGLIWAGRYEEANQIIVQTRVAALAIADERSLARVAYLHGVLLDRTGAYAEAADSLAEAAFSAARWHDDRLAAQALTKLAYVTGVRQTQLASGEYWARHARAAIERLDGGRDRLFAQLEGVLGSLRLTAGDPGQARLHFERSLAGIRAIRGDAHCEAAAIHNNLGGALLEAGDHTGAHQQFEAARALWHDAFGAAHPDLAHAWTNLGVVAEAAGDYEQAREHHEQALDMLARTLGPRSEPVARAALNLGTTLYRAGAYDQARMQFEAAIEVFETGPVAPPELGNACVGLALIEVDQDRLTEAEFLLQRALTVWETSLGPDHPRVAVVLGNLGDVAMRLGRLEQATVYLTRAIVLKERGLDEDHPSLAFPLTVLGKVLIERGDAAAARLQLERALSLRETNPGVGRRLLAETQFGLARAYWNLEEHGKAIELAELARDGFDGPSSAAASDVAMVERWLVTRQPVDTRK